MENTAALINMMEGNAGLSPTPFLNDPYIAIVDDSGEKKEYLVAGEIDSLEDGEYFGVFQMTVWIDADGHKCCDWAGVPEYMNRLEK